MMHVVGYAVAVSAAICMACAASYAIGRRKLGWYLSLASVLAVAAAIGLLISAFVNVDINLFTAALHSNSQAPLYVKVTAAFSDPGTSLLLVALGVVVGGLAAARSEERSGAVCYSIASLILASSLACRDFLLTSGDLGSLVKMIGDGFAVNIWFRCPYALPHEVLILLAYGLIIAAAASGGKSRALGFTAWLMLTAAHIVGGVWGLVSWGSMVSTFILEAGALAIWLLATAGIHGSSGAWVLAGCGVLVDAAVARIGGIASHHVFGFYPVQALLLGVCAVLILAYGYRLVGESLLHSSLCEKSMVVPGAAGIATVVVSCIVGLARGQPVSLNLEVVVAGVAGFVAAYGALRDWRIAVGCAIAAAALSLAPTPYSWLALGPAAVVAGIGWAKSRGLEDASHLGFALAAWGMLATLHPLSTMIPLAAGFQAGTLARIGKTSVEVARGAPVALVASGDLLAKAYGAELLLHVVKHVPSQTIIGYSEVALTGMGVVAGYMRGDAVTVLCYGYAPVIALAGALLLIASAVLAFLKARAYASQQGAASPHQLEA